MNSEQRPPIPAEIKRRVLVEAGHRCAIPTCRHIQVELHHIIPWATCRSHEYDNLIALCPNCHLRADRGEIDRKALRLYKVNLRFVHDKYSQLEMDMMFDLYRAGPEAGAPWAPYMLIFFKRALESGFLDVIRPAGIQTYEMGIETTKMFLLLTDRGRAFIQELGMHEL